MVVLILFHSYTAIKHTSELYCSSIKSKGVRHFYTKKSYYVRFRSCNNNLRLQI